MDEPAWAVSFLQQMTMQQSPRLQTSNPDIKARIDEIWELLKSSENGGTFDLLTRQGSVFWVLVTRYYKPVPQVYTSRTTLRHQVKVQNREVHRLGGLS